jgi:hypothetical protein
MTIEFMKSTAHLANAVAFATKKPSITGYIRLETQPTAISLKTGLQAPLADPLWMLARQWQFNEFQGEDAGTPIKLAFTVEGKAVDRFRSGHDDGQPWDTLAAGDAPLETRVEAEPVWDTHPRLRGEAGLQLLRMVSNSAVRAALLATYPLNLQISTDPEVDQAGALWSTLFNQRTVDAQTLAADLLPLLNGTGNLIGLPAALVIDPGDIAVTQTTLENWFAWLADLVFEGGQDNPAWQRERMEYAFALRSGNVILKAAEYTDGHVDWEDFRAESAVQEDNAPPQVIHQFAVAQRHPSPVRYPGMPAERYWEFEDGRVNFAGAEAGVTDLLRISVTEFALSFGNDWFITPVRLPVGWLYKVNGFKITDTFGITSLANSIEPTGNTPWTMYEMTADANLNGQLHDTMFLPDSLDGVQEGAVLEHTLLARDEMANLAWAIEKKVQGVSGEPLDRDMEAKLQAFQQQIHFDQLPDSPQLVYRLATPVPANWTPLLPVRKKSLNLDDPLEIQLERAGMKRFYPEATVEVIGSVDSAYEQFLKSLDAQKNFITRKLPIDPPDPNNPPPLIYEFYPRGWLLRKDPNNPFVFDGPDADKLVIEEEEVPRIGASIKRKFQYARSSDGKSWLWIGRSKVAGRGEAESNLRFDVAVKTNTMR